MRFVPAPLRRDAARLWDWWSREMLAVLPARWRPREMIELVARSEGNGLTLRRQGEAVAHLPPGSPWPAGLPRQPVVLAVSTDRVLRRRLSLPAAAERRLRDVVRYELERLTPLRPEQLLFQAAPVGHGEQGGIEVEVTLVPRAAAEVGLAQLQRAGVQPIAVEIADGATPVRLPLDEPGDASPARFARRALLVAATLLAILVAPLLARAAQLWLLEREVAELEPEASRLGSVLAELDALQAKADHAARRKADAPVAIVILEALARLLPDDTHLTDLRFDGATVQLVGRSRNASALIPLLEESPHFSGVQFRSALVREPSGLDRFDISADVVPHDHP